MKHDIEWVKSNLIPTLKEYKFEFRYFEDGDFGTLDEYNFGSSRFIGSIGFWGAGWLSIQLIDIQKEEVLLDVLLAPYEEARINESWDKLLKILYLGED